MMRFASLLFAALVLAGCTSQPSPEQRPYTDAEIKQFALEMLNRSGLPYEDYMKIRSALLDPNHRMSNAIRDPAELERLSAGG